MYYLDFPCLNLYKPCPVYETAGHIPIPFYVSNFYNLLLRLGYIKKPAIIISNF
jgi:hypothetical protein